MQDLSNDVLTQKAYSITSAYTSNGICFTTSGSKIVLSSAYSEVLPSANGKVTLDANGQQSFIDFLGFSTCSGGGENIVPTALIQVTNTTATQTSTHSNVPLAAASASLTIAPVSVGSLLTSLLALCLSRAHPCGTKKVHDTDRIPSNLHQLPPLQGQSQVAPRPPISLLLVRTAPEHSPSSFSEV